MQTEGSLGNDGGATAHYTASGVGGGGNGKRAEAWSEQEKYAGRALANLAKG